jgi:hypothetical protein
LPRRIEKEAVSVKQVFAGIPAGAGLALMFAASIAGAQVIPSADHIFSGPGSLVRSGFLHVGHDNIVVDPSVRRFTGMVSALGSPDAHGKLYTFKASPVGPRSFKLSVDDLRGWRMTVLSGKRFGQVFTVSGNTESEITVKADKGPVDGLDVRDVFIIESVDANGVSMFGPAAGASPSISPGT